jgi:hypothetical protein
MSRRRKYTKENLMKVVELVNIGKMKKIAAIKKAGFKTRQSYYDTLRSLGLQETLTIEPYSSFVTKIKKDPPKRVTFI